MRTNESLQATDEEDSKISLEYGSVNSNFEQERPEKQSKLFISIRKTLPILILIMLTFVANVVVTKTILSSWDKKHDQNNFEFYRKSHFKSSFSASQCPGIFRESFTSFSASGVPKRGSELLIDAKGTILDGSQISSGFISIDVHYGKKQVYFVKDLSLCGSSKHELPFDAGALSSKGLNCPTSSGQGNIQLGVKLPWFTPGGSYNITTRGCTDDSCDIFCVNAIMTF